MEGSRGFPSYVWREAENSIQRRLPEIQDY